MNGPHQQRAAQLFAVARSVEQAVSIMRAESARIAGKLLRDRNRAEAVAAQTWLAVEFAAALLELAPHDPSAAGPLLTARVAVTAQLAAELRDVEGPAVEERRHAPPLLAVLLGGRFVLGG